MQLKWFADRVALAQVIAAPNADLPKFLISETAKYQKIVDFAKIKE